MSWMLNHSTFSKLKLESVFPIKLFIAVFVHEGVGLVFLLEIYKNFYWCIREWIEGLTVLTAYWCFDVKDFVAICHFLYKGLLIRRCHPRIRLRRTLSHWEHMIQWLFIFCDCNHLLNDDVCLFDDLDDYLYDDDDVFYLIDVVVYQWTFFFCHFES